jgi:hypothetical protein
MLLLLIVLIIPKKNGSCQNFEKNEYRVSFFYAPSRILYPRL